MTPEERLKQDPINFTPANEKEFALALGDPLYRLSHLYKIMIKDDEEGDDGEESLVITFVPNEAQLSLIRQFHWRNIILKARQLGFTTLVAILFLDCCLFRANVRAGMIAQTDPIAKKLFRDKVKFAYDNLPDQLKAAMPLRRDSADELLFDHNGSSIWVSTSMRGGTLQYLHVSEFGKICARYPVRAEEVVTGAFPAVSQNGIVFIESTAEGRDGHFYKMVEKSRQLKEQGRPLTKKQYKFHFFAWWMAAEYRMDPENVIITQRDHRYFDELETIIQRKIDIEQRAWYIETRENEFHGDQNKMFQEHPSTPDEAFQVSNEGCWFKSEMAAVRQQGRLKESLPILPGIPCMTFWDIGNTDGMAIWVIQRVEHEFRCVHFFEAWGEPYSAAAKWLQSLGVVFDTHWLPHDAEHVRQGQSTNKSPRQMLEELMPGNRFEIVPRIEDVTWGISQTRDVFPLLWFDETRCKPGIIHLDLYSKKWNQAQGVWTDIPNKLDGHSEAADALRQFGQAYAGGLLNVRKPTKKRKPRNWRVT